MNQTDQIVEEYKSSDFEKRLNLFLECPSLRTKFLEIDQNNEDDAASAKKALKKGFGKLHSLHLLLFHPC
ncbi:hypothetical protein ACFL1Z_03935 [Thermodesulfobacteriota bacterium]